MMWGDTARPDTRSYSCYPVETVDLFADRPILAECWEAHDRVEKR